MAPSLTREYFFSDNNKNKKKKKKKKKKNNNNNNNNNENRLHALSFSYVQKSHFHIDKRDL